MSPTKCMNKSIRKNIRKSRKNIRKSRKTRKLMQST